MLGRRPAMSSPPSGKSYLTPLSPWSRGELPPWDHFPGWGRWCDHPESSGLGLAPNRYFGRSIGLGLWQLRPQRRVSTVPGGQ